MKGIVEFVVRDKYGRIKETRKEHNQITDAFKAKIEKYINEYIPFRTSSVSVFPTTGASDFQGIWLHSEQVADKYDIPPIMLSGGIAAREYAVDTSYASAIVNTTDDATKTITTSWAWVIPRSMSINAVTLHRKEFIEGTLVNTGRLQLLPLSSDEFLACPYRVQTGRSNYRSVYFQPLRISGIDMSGLNRSLQSIRKITYGSCTPTHSGVIVTENNYVSVGVAVTWDPDETLFVIPNERVKEIDAFGNKEKFTSLADRMFTRSQFVDIPSGTVYVTSLPTKTKDFIFVSPSGTSGALKIYELPRTSSSDQIQPVASVSFKQLSESKPVTSRITVYRNFAVFNVDDNSECTVFHVKKDGSFEIYTGTPINGDPKYINGSSEYPYSSNFRFQSLERQFPDDKMDGLWSTVSNDPVNTEFRPDYMVHNTILNLQSPLSLNQDDTLTITYKIIAS